jgi:hypothetical protein
MFEPFKWLSIFVCVLFAAQSSAVAAGDDGSDAANAYLDQLVGDWIMTGTVMGKPVKYALHSARVLQSGFLRLSMVDVLDPPQYEADVYVGYDPKARDYIAHWLDRFGAAGARVVATGRRTGQKLILRFPYAEGAFRDTFAFDPGKGTWSLLLEAQGRDRKWTVFANFAVERR